MKTLTTKTRIAKPLAILCVLTVMYGVTAWNDFEKQILHAEPNSELSLRMLQSDSLLIRSLSSADGFSLAEGHWQFPGMPWGFSQSQPMKESALPSGEQSEVATSAEQPVELDQHFLALIKSLMTIRRTDGQQTWYHVNSALLRGTAITVQSHGVEVPVVLRFRWLAHSDLWTEVAAIREEQDSHPPLLQFPAGTQMIATRIAASGLPQCHLISISSSVQNIPQLFSANGWTVEYPPANTQLEGLFWISNATGRFEISVKSATGISHAIAFVRSI